MTKTETKGGPVLVSFTDQQLLEELVRRYVDRAVKKKDENRPSSDARWWLKRYVENYILDAAGEMRMLSRERIKAIE